MVRFRSIRHDLLLLPFLIVMHVGPHWHLCFGEGTAESFFGILISI